MKQVIIAGITSWLLATGMLQAQVQNITVKDSLKDLNQNINIEWKENIADRKKQADTVSIINNEGISTEEVENRDEAESERSKSTPAFMDASDLEDILIPVVAIVVGCAVPVLIVFFVFYFMYKNRKEKSRLAAQILAAGQPIPDEFFKQEIQETNLQTKGIRNISIGIGLTVLLGMLTKRADIGCIGVLIVCIGIGQVVTFYVQRRMDRNSNQKSNQKVEEVKTEEKKAD